LALDLAEALELPEVLCRGWTAKAYIAAARRPEEARGLFQLTLDMALAHDLHELAATACANLSDHNLRRDRYVESLAYLEQTRDLALTIGNRATEWFALSEMTYALTMLGRWDEALDRFAELPDEVIGTNTQVISPLTGILELYLQRGRLDHARTLLMRYDELARSTDVQTRGGYHSAAAGVRLAEGNPREALAIAEQAFAEGDVVGMSAQDVKLGFMHAVEAALTLGERQRANELLSIVEELPSGLRPPVLTATTHRFRARLAGADPSAEHEFKAAASQMAELEVPFHLAVIQLEYGEWLAAQGRDEESADLLREARETFERLEAAPWLERVDAASASGRTEVPV
jgi:tetratricopeptide (TPR) repeat protein